MNNERSLTISDPPVFENLNWPAMCSELPEGRLVITGNLNAPAGYDPYCPISLFVFPGVGCENPGIAGGQIGEMGMGVEDPLANADVLEKVKLVEDYVKGNRKAQGNGDDDFPPGCQGYGILLLDNPYDNNEYSYFHAETPYYGRFRLDFDQWCRFTPYDKLLILVGVDANGGAIVATNIYKVPQYSPETIAAAEPIRNQYGSMMSEFGQGIIDVLSFYPVEHQLDITVMNATKACYEQAYLGPPSMSHYKTIGETYGQQMAQIAPQINDPLFRAAFIEATNHFSEEFIRTGENKDAGHFLYLFTFTDPYQIFWDTLASAEEFYNTYIITVIRQPLPGGGLRVLIDIDMDGVPFANLEMVGRRSSPLQVTGNVGSHIIQGVDYNPLFIQIFGLLVEEGFYPCISY